MSLWSSVQSAGHGFLSDIPRYNVSHRENRMNKRTHRGIIEKFSTTRTEMINIQELIVQKGYGKIYKRYADQCEWTR